MTRSVGLGAVRLGYAWLFLVNDRVKLIAYWVLDRTKPDAKNEPRAAPRAFRRPAWSRPALEKAIGRAVPADTTRA